MELQAKLPSAYTCLGSTLDYWNFLSSEGDILVLLSFILDRFIQKRLIFNFKFTKGEQSK